MSKLRINLDLSTMKQVKRKFDASFEGKVAIEAIKESETLSSLAASMRFHLL